MIQAIHSFWLTTLRHTGRLTPVIIVALGLLVYAPAAAQEGGTTHTVQAGENLYRIALQYGLTVADLLDNNEISDPTRIYAGQVLTIPVTAAETGTELHNAAVNPAPDTSTFHSVQSGETLITIAEQYGMDWLDLAAANGLGEPNNIIVGQKLLIPATATAPTTAEPLAAASTSTETEAAASASTAAAVENPAPNAAEDDYYIPDQVTEIHPAETAADDLGILPADSAETIIITTEDGFTVPDQVQAVSPAPSAIDLGILPVESAAASAPAQTTAAAATTNAAASANNPVVSASGERTHIVQAGEHLASIAALYGLSYPTLAMANNISDPNHIYSGQSLIIPDQDYAPSTYVAQQTAAPAAAPTITSGKQIVVDLSDQRVYLYENGTLLRNVLVSTGTSAYPTVQGDYKVYLKYESQTMSGPGYNLPGVPYVLYFYKGYSLHGTYWHSNFGTPMSHGCVNMPTPEAQWLFNWAPEGTPVHVQW